MPNIVIIGGGPAGLSAAIYAVRAGMQATVLYKDGGALAKTDKIENYFGAHPTLYHMGKDNLSSLVRHLKEAGLVALEAVYSTYSAGEERQMRQLAARYGLLISGGSDFHGKSKPGLELGTGYGKLFIPEDILIALKKKRKELFDV